MNNWWWAKCEAKQNFIVTSTSNQCSQSDWPWMIRVMYSPPKKDFYTTCFFLYFFASLLSSYFACTYQNKVYVVDVVVVVHQSFCCLNFFLLDIPCNIFFFQSYLFCLALLNDRFGFQYDVYFVVNLVSFVLPIGKTIFPFPIFFLPFFSRLFC